MASISGSLDKWLGAARKATPAAIRPGLWGAQKLLQGKKGKKKSAPKVGLMKAHTSNTRYPSQPMGDFKTFSVAEEYATSGKVNFDEDYWRKQAEATWGKASAKKLARLRRESKHEKKTLDENLGMSLEYIAQNKAFTWENLQTTMKRLGKEQEWAEEEFNEVWEAVIRTREYLRDDFEKQITKFAYDRGVEREEIAQTIMPAAEKVREESWASGLGDKGLGSRESRNIAKARIQAINRSKKAEEFKTEAATTTRDRGLRESDAREKSARKELLQKTEDIGMRDDAAETAYHQTLAKYGLDEKAARLGHTQGMRGINLAQRGGREEIDEARQIGIEDYVQSRRGEAYQRVAADPMAGVRNISTPMYKSTPISGTYSSRGGGFSTGVAKRSREKSGLFAKTGRFLRGLF